MHVSPLLCRSCIGRQSLPFLGFHTARGHPFGVMEDVCAGCGANPRTRMMMRARHQLAFAQRLGATHGSCTAALPSRVPGLTDLLIPTMFGCTSLHEEHWTLQKKV